MAVVFVIIAGIMARVVPVLREDFPLNDGALFLSMAEDIRTAGFALPDVATYNGLDAPFAYPPLGLYLAAALQAIGIDGLDVLRWVPLLASVATIPVVLLIGREVFRSEGMALGTAAFFAVSTGSYEWLVMGGGITRAPGFLLALVAVLLAIRAYRQGVRALSIGAGVALGVTGLAHPQAAVFGILSVVLMVAFFAGDRRRALASMAIILGTSAVVVAPWLLVVVARHGIEPFLSAAGTGGTPLLGLLSLVTSRTSAGYLEVLGFATTLGLIVSGMRGFWLAPVWMVAIIIVDGRAGQPYVAVPAAMVVTFMLRDLGSVVGRRLPTLGARAPAAIGAVLLVAAFADSLAAQASGGTPLRAVPESARSAMAWAAEETDPDASFVVVSGRYWAVDAESEWFPVLADRRSLATVQGYEWLGADAFERQRMRALELPECVAADDLECIADWFATAGEVDYLLLTHSEVAEAAGLDCCLGLADQMADLRATEVVRHADGVMIVRLLPADGG